MEEKVYFTNFRKFVDVNLDRLQDSILRKSLELSMCALTEKNAISQFYEACEKNDLNVRSPINLKKLCFSHVLMT